MHSFAYGALWIFIFVLPWENMVTIPGLGTLSKALGIFALVITAFAPLISGRVRRLRLFHISALVFVLWAASSVLRVQEYQQKWAQLRSLTYVQLLLMVWMIWELAPDVRRQRGLLMAYVLGAYVSGMATILAYLTGRGTSATLRRFAAEGFDANALGTILALAVPIAWYLGLTYQRPILQWICRAYLPVGVFAIGLTASRGALVVGTVALLIVPLTLTRLSPGRMVGTILLLIACGTLAAVYVPQSSLDRFGTISSEVEEGRFGGRGDVWVAGLRAFAQRPLLGHGSAGFKSAVAPYLGRAIVAHNTYLQVLVEQGILGFVPWFMMFVAVILQVRRLPHLERRFGLVLMATLGIALLPLSWDERKTVWFILAILAAFADSLRPRRAGTTAIQQRHPLQAVAVARRAAPPRPRGYPAAPPSAGPTGTPIP
jgi:O-antigen ligase